MSYRLVFYPYSGLGTVEQVKAEDMTTCRQRAARLIRDHRNDLEYPVTVLKKGSKWELESDPDGMSMVGDSEGILSIQEVEDDDDWEDEWENESDEPTCPECDEVESCCMCDEEEDEDE